MTVQIVTDSGADIPPALAAAHGISVVPLQVLIDGVSYRDGVDLTPMMFYEKMRTAKKLPQTSQPTPHDVESAYRAAAERGPVVGVHLSSALSGTWETASMAARSISETIRVFDSRTGSAGIGLMAMRAAELARGGATAAEIWAYLEAWRAETHTLVALNTLENAVRGGRVNPLAGMAARLLHVKPIVHVTRAGKVEPIDRVRGRERALERTLDLAGELRKNWADRRVAVAHGGAAEEAKAFARRVRERFNPAEVWETEIGATIGTYSAEGAILFSF
ncbi:MAG: protein DegV family [Symbiobacteriaceae bacterium]|jgi:DegV family protein with EDD domain|nr:protein DegV family [Symbiobacteriaceae bacterium]